MASTSPPKEQPQGLISDGSALCACSTPRVPALICMVVALVLLSLRTENGFHPARYLRATPRGAAVGRVAVWRPPLSSCRGVWHDGPLNASRKDGHLTFFLRDVLVDNRFASRKEFTGRPENERRPFRRLVAHVSLTPQKENESPDPLFKDPTHGIFAEGVGSEQARRSSYATLRGPGGSSLATGVEVSLDYVISPAECMYNQKDYQLIVSLFGPVGTSEEDLDDDLDLMVSDGTELLLSLGMRFPNGTQRVFAPRARLSCVFGLHRTQGLETVPVKLPLRPETCHEAQGSVMLAGGALFGFKKEDPKKWHLLAQFAARTLRGPIRFDFIVASISIRHSVSAMQDQCGDSMRCWRRLEAENLAEMNNIARATEAELSAIGIPENFWSRVVIIPHCRLGTDHVGEEKASPCILSRMYGQFLQNTMTYSLFSHYFRYVASVDIDEFFIDSRMHDANVAAASASHVLAAEIEQNRLQGREYPEAVTAPWIDFSVKAKDMRKLSLQLVQGEQIDLEYGGEDEKAPRNLTRSCESIRAIWGGSKSVHACNAGGGGFGFRVRVDCLHEKRGAGSLLMISLLMATNSISNFYVCVSHPLL